jgi:WD40 repeat protein
VASFDTILIQPTRDELAAAIGAAENAANGRCQFALVLLTPADVEALLAEVRAAPEGTRQRSGGQTRRQSPRHTSLLRLAWWTDALGRKHHRIRGDRIALDDHTRRQVFSPRNGSRPALWEIYPDSTYLRTVSGQREPVVVCPCGVAGREEEVGWMGQLCGACHDRREEGNHSPSTRTHEQTTLVGHNGSVLSVVFAPDGKTLASCGDDGMARLWDQATGREQSMLYETELVVPAIAFSPDGLHLAVAETAAVWIYDVASGRQLDLKLGGEPVSALAYSPDGRRLAGAGPTRTLVWEEGRPADERLFELSPAHGVWPADVQFSPDGGLIATTAGNAVQLWDANSGRLHQTLGGHTSTVHSLSFSPGGWMLASGGAGWTVRVWDLNERRELACLQGHTDTINSVAFSPDGHFLVSTSDDETVRLWDVISGQAVTLEWHQGRVWCAAFSPDGQWLATGGDDGIVKLWPWRALLGGSDGRQRM